MTFKFFGRRKANIPLLPSGSKALTHKDDLEDFRSRLVQLARKVPGRKYQCECRQRRRRRQGSIGPGEARGCVGTRDI